MTRSALLLLRSAALTADWESLAKSQGQWPRIKLRHEVIRADWDATDSAYYITVRDLTRDVTDIYRADILLNAAGVLTKPRLISLPGTDSFNGTIFHAAEWPDDLRPEDLRGKQVVVVGNGCSGVQIVGTLGQDPGIKIVNVAKAKQWFIPSPPGEKRHSVAYTDEQRRRWKTWPGLMRAQRVIAQAVMDYRFYWYKTEQGKKARKWLEDGIGGWMRQTLPEYMRETAIPNYCKWRGLLDHDGGAVPTRAIIDSSVRRPAPDLRGRLLRGPQLRPRQVHRGAHHERARQHRRAR